MFGTVSPLPEELAQRLFGGEIEPPGSAVAEHGGPDPVPEVLQLGLAGIVAGAVVQEVVHQLIERPEFDPELAEFARRPDGCAIARPARQPRRRPE